MYQNNVGKKNLENGRIEIIRVDKCVSSTQKSALVEKTCDSIRFKIWYTFHQIVIRTRHLKLFMLHLRGAELFSFRWKDDERLRAKIYKGRLWFSGRQQNETVRQRKTEW